MEFPLRITLGAICRPNPGGIGVWAYTLHRHDKFIHQASGVAGEGPGMTCYQASLTGLTEAAAWLVATGITGNLIIASNAELVLRQVRGLWKVNQPKAKSIIPISMGGNSYFSDKDSMLRPLFHSLMMRGAMRCTR